MAPLPQNQQRALVERLIKACGGGYSPETRRKYYISGPQWAAAYEGHALFHSPTREPVSFEKVIEEYEKIGIGHSTTHDTDAIPTAGRFKDEQEQIVARIKASPRANGLKCSMVTTETFHHRVWAASPPAEASEVRAYAARRLENTVKVGQQLGAEFAVYWPGSLGYFVQVAVEETQTLKWYAEGLNATCETDSRIAKEFGRPTLKHCMEAKPFEPQAEILSPTSDAMLAWISSGMLTHPEMVGLNPEYLHELMWGAAPRAALARALMCGKLWHLDINDGYRLKHDVDIAVGLMNPPDWLNLLMPWRSHSYNGWFPRTTGRSSVSAISFSTGIERTITEGASLRPTSGELKSPGREAVFVETKEPRTKLLGELGVRDKSASSTTSWHGHRSPGMRVARPRLGDSFDMRLLQSLNPRRAVMAATFSGGRQSQPKSSSPRSRGNTAVQSIQQSISLESRQTDSAPQEPLRLFISHGHNKGSVKNMKDFLDLLKVDYALAVEDQCSAISVPSKIDAVMSRCNAAVIIVAPDEPPKRGVEPSINENVLIEIGLARALYHDRVILFWDRRLRVPSNLQGLYRCEFDGRRSVLSEWTKLCRAVMSLRTLPIVA